MALKRRGLLFALLLPIVACASAATAPSEEQILGAWTCDEGDCPDPELEFAIEEGEHVFRTWLHARPATRAQWQLNGDTLTILSSDMRDEWQVVEVNRRTLRLRRLPTGEPAVLRRLP
ncbi:MAG: hypothetical protein F9K16_02380 [Thermoanaerobaculia bacterium]|nr:MAG: hypothetical protein F9K16_02380 [Thermoanaerobaculia bacterium]MBZ0103796.1 hypothetical protein [Thermoanaerobaculia bacterium]